ncbi:Nucleoporin [Beauveria bassiana D1-5]|uniref:Nucleoporin n=1 Tax=Beauveria bassiana D1-5 TaxID=1245745 RepID=A0A0A2VNN2_BEABA|nr:Nucleoporin [Beauveria bassiana D1-5]
MSFGGGGFGGFGQNNNNNQQQSSAFGTFGQNNNTTNTGFGAAANPSGFGTTTAGGVFGSGNNTGGGFGSGGGFGTNNNAGGAFGSKPSAFGAPATTTGNSMFGGTTANNTTNTGFGGFGTTNNANTASAFGANNTNTTGGIFGGAKPGGFGAATTGNSLFGGGNTTNTTGAFGANTGFGANTTLGGGDPPGTAVAPFQAFNEKESGSTASNISNSFQNICFQDPYKKWSAEELRLVDYVQGRKHGNASGTGAFGVSSGFGGGFGATNTNAQTTNAFGSNTANNTAGGGIFGGSNNNANTGGAFGSAGTPAFGTTNANTGGSLFGAANKPATGGGIFGSSAPQTQQTGGGLFGAANNNASAFGANNNNATNSAFGAPANNTGGGLFANANQNKPAGTGFSFGQTANTNAAGSAFGGGNTASPFGAANTTNTGGGVFGSNTNNNAQQTTGGVFGNATQQQTSTASPFGAFGGQQNQQQQTGGGLFGSQNKPATGGLFGGGANTTANATGGNLFGNANNANNQQPTSAFGQNTGGGLFGAAKPASGGGLFGSSTNAQTNTGGGSLFGGGTLGQNNTQQNTGGSLFGAANNQQKPGGLFGASNQNAGGSVFGGQNNQAQGSSLFGGANNQQNQQGSAFGGSLLGNSQQNPSAPLGLTANLNDVSAYGTPALFANLGGNESPNPGPLATPLNGNSKPRRSSILPMYKLAPASASRFATPQKRGFGFSYSSYGTPGGSPASSLSSTPSGLGRSLLGSGSSGNLSKSMSTNNLRRTFNSEDSILAPGAFSASSNSRWYGSTGSKKLVINREIRSDLFTTPQKEKPVAEGNGTGRKLLKRVSFDTSHVDSEETATPVRAPFPPDDSPSTQNEDTPRQPKPTVNGTKSPEMEQVSSGRELAVVQEDSTTADSATATDAPISNGFDNAPGGYWMRPSKDELMAMNRVNRSKIDGFTVGRDNVGQIKFKVPVDLSTIDLDEICGDIVQLEPRSATVYPVAAKKPLMGRGLNVPARISLEQSWPRGGREKRVTSDPKRFSKHVERLKRIPDTTFESYDKDTGVWTFSVEHFTTYAMPDDDDETDGDGSSELPPQMEIETAPQAMALDEIAGAPSESNRQALRRNGVPGAFDESEEVHGEEQPLKQSFLGISSADSAPNEVRLALEMDDLVDMGEEYDEFDSEDTANASVEPHHAAELEQASPEDEQDAKVSTPGGILRARMRAIKESAGPVRLEVADGDDWTEMLRKTVSPMKRDRQELRELNESPSRRAGGQLDDNLNASVWGRRSVGRPDKHEGLAANAALDKSVGFATSIDLMNSLFEKPKPIREKLRVSSNAKGFPQLLQMRKDKSFDTDEKEHASQRTPRVSWGLDETLVVTQPRDSHFSSQILRDSTDILSITKTSVGSVMHDVYLGKLYSQSFTRYLQAQDKLTDVRMLDGAPFAALRQTSLQNIFHHQDMTDPANMYEKQVWELADILFGHDSTSNLSDHLARKKKLSEFWTVLVEEASSIAIGKAASSEEKAVACLAGHRITEACKYLLEGKNFRIGTLVSLIGTCDSARKEMKEQLQSWQDSKMLSEFPEAIRAIYEVLSGNVCVCGGLKDVPVEDRMESFFISQRFGLDWRQAFGMRLWYALSKDEDAKSAVKRFQEDINENREDLPETWYMEQGVKPIWDDYDLGKRQDLLWGLLQLYAEPMTDLEAVIRPENSQLSPLDTRLCWQLGQALTSTGKVSYGDHDASKADAATVSYAAQLTSASEWLDAIFVLLHLRDAVARKQALQEHLCRHASRIGAENGPVFTTLTEKLLIPASWIWEALALYQRSVTKDAPLEVQCLLRAGSFEEAHRVLVNQVAPRAIVERDYAGLSELISQLKGRQDSISQWSLGGEVYGHFLALMQHRRKRESIPSALLERLLVGLNAMSESGPETEILRYAAISDMADETARETVKMAKKKQDMDLRSRILHLPLTQDRLLAYSVDLGLDRYREVVSY